MSSGKFKTLLPYFTKVNLNSHFKLYVQGKLPKKNVLPFLDFNDIKVRFMFNPREEEWNEEKERYEEKRVLKAKIENCSLMGIDDLAIITRSLKNTLDSTNLEIVGSKLFLAFKGLRGKFVGLPRPVLDFFKSFSEGRQEVLIRPFYGVCRPDLEGDDLDYNMGFWEVGYEFEDQKYHFIFARRGRTTYEHFLMICHAILESLSYIKGSYPEEMETAITPSIRCDAFIHDYNEKKDIYIEVERDWRNVIPKSKKYRKLRRGRFEVIFYVPQDSREKCKELDLRLPSYRFKYYRYLPTSPIITKTINR